MREEATTSADQGKPYKREMGLSVRTRRGSCNWSSDSEVLQDFSLPEVVEYCGGLVQDNKVVDDRRSAPETAKSSYEAPVKDVARSRRTLRRSTSVDEVETRISRAPVPQALATIYSPTHEILHPMRTLLLQNSCSTTFLQPSPERLTLLLESSCSTKLLQSSHKSLAFLPSGDAIKIKAYKPPDSVSLLVTKFPNEDGIREVADTLSESRPSDAGTPGNFVKEFYDEDRSGNFQENVDPGPVATVMVVIIDADKKLKLSAVDWALANVAQPGDEIILLGVLQHIISPMGHRVLADLSKTFGVSDLCMETEISRRLEAIEKKVTESGRRKACEQKNVKLTVRVSPAANPKAVVVREVAAVKATWAIFDRNVMKDRKYFGEHLSCHVVRMRRDERSAETICSLGQTLKKSCLVSLTSDTLSVSPLSSDSRSRRFWSKITRFRSSREFGSSSPGSSSESSSPRTILPTTMAEDSESCGSEAPEESFSFGSPKDNIDLDNLSAKLKSFYLGQEADSTIDVPSSVAAEEFVYNQGLDAYRRHRAGFPVPAVLVS